MQAVFKTEALRCLYHGSMQIHLSGWSFKSEVRSIRIRCVWDSAVVGPEVPQLQSFGKWHNWALLCLSVPSQLPDGQVGIMDYFCTQPADSHRSAG